MGTHSGSGSHRIHRSSRFFAEHGYLEVPSLVQWMATLKCGLACEHCLAVSRESGFSDMPLEEVERLIDEIAALGVAEFLLTGGEPLAREDLAEVIAYLGRQKVNWTLNTAALPSRQLCQVIARHRPGFVAVSLDGPRRVHDAFRGRAGAWDEAMEAIRFFTSLEGVRVCVGTTVTRRNYDALDETFHLVTASGADQWGIHLLVPEGRAAERPDLFLSRAQLKRLIKFVARKRQYFRVEMADEIGYLGYLEPLVRDVPLRCAAGRSQCVVLPDGEVVPCTTLDRSCSAGNIYRRPLREIWAEGFQNLRSWQPTGKCKHCEYAMACRGGCWLQRKSGTQCFKEVWHVPAALKTAAGIAVCLGGMAASGDAAALPAPGPAQDVVKSVVLDDPPRGTPVAGDVAPVYLDEAIMKFYVELAAALDPGSYHPPREEVDCNDVACRFFESFKDGTLPQDVSERCAMVCDALATEQRSLSLIALLWRAVSGPLFETDDADPNQGGPAYRMMTGPLLETNGADEYSDLERQTIRDTLAALEHKARKWRLEIFAENLDPYLSDGRQVRPPHGVMSKAGPRPGDYEFWGLSKDINEERWGVGDVPDSHEAAVTYLLEHRYADQMDLTFDFSEPGSFIRYRGGEGEFVSSHIGDIYTGSHTMGVFDVIATTEDVALSFELKGTLRLASRYDGTREHLLNDCDGQQDIRRTCPVLLAGGREYTYVELLNAVYDYEQRSRNLLLEMAYDWILPESVEAWNQELSVVVAVYENEPLLWPALREIIESDPLEPPLVLRGEVREGIWSADPNEVHRKAVLKDIDFWMF